MAVPWPVVDYLAEQLGIGDPPAVKKHGERKTNRGPERWRYGTAGSVAAPEAWRMTSASLVFLPARMEFT